MSHTDNCFFTGPQGSPVLNLKSAPHHWCSALQCVQHEYHVCCIASPLCTKDPKADHEQPGPGVQTHGQLGSASLSQLWIILHSCSQRRKYKEKSWCLSSIPFCSAFSLLFHTWREIIEWVSIAPSYPTKLLWLRGRIVLDSVQTDLGSVIFVFPSIRMFSHQQTGYLFRFIFSCDIVSFQIMLTIIFNDAVPTRAVHSSRLSTDIFMLRKAKGREFITEAPFRLLARCSETPVVPSHFLWTRINWSIQPSRVYSTLFPFGTYSIFCKRVMKRVQLIMLISFLPSIL